MPYITVFEDKLGMCLNYWRVSAPDGAPFVYARSIIASIVSLHRLQTTTPKNMMTLKLYVVEIFDVNLHYLVCDTQMQSTALLYMKKQCSFKANFSYPTF